MKRAPRNRAGEVDAGTELFDFVRDLQLPTEDFAVFGSGPLIVRKIIPSTNDLDIICRKDAWQRVKSLGEFRYLEQYDVSVVSMRGDTITFGTAWGIGDFDVDLLIDTAENISSLPFVRLNYVIEYKTIANRAKDIEHINAAREQGFVR